MGQGRRPRLILAVALLAACGSKPAPAKPDPRVAELEQQLTDTKAALVAEKEAADLLRGKDAELQAKADEAKALQDKLAEAVGKAGEVTTADGAVKLELVDQILFAVGEADLTQQGKDVLGRVGVALKETDKQIWVQGHTDDQPIMVRKPKTAPPPPPTKKKKGAKAEPPPKKEPEKPDAVLAFMTNWELSAARALTVVHYLQDEAKLDPTRLAAVAFSQYRPVSKVKSKNRRIEIVLYPRAKITPK
ncbi:MAG: OmpA family protein [Deltaproteobacteria bacterium]|nr:OmpA family protein [Deltaproteobacteria bacterium]